MNSTINYQVYSEFKNSDWYIYWDMSFSKCKDLQLLMVWHIDSDICTCFDYINLEKILEDNTLKTYLPPYQSNLSESDIFDLYKICGEFKMDVDVKFNT